MAVAAIKYVLRVTGRFIADILMMEVVVREVRVVMPSVGWEAASVAVTEIFTTVTNKLFLSTIVN